jgi:folate-binding protein YgfZ
MGESLPPGYQALCEGAALLDLSGRGKIRVTGEDRARLLHAMTTNHVQQLTPGAGCYAFFLNAQGRILADVNVLCFEDHLLLDTEPETREKVYRHLDKYIIADDVTLEDCTEAMATLGVEGPGAAHALAAVGAPLPEAECGTMAWPGGVAARLNASGEEGYFLFAASETKDRIGRQLMSAGAVRATEADWRAVRIENGKPRYGEEFADTNLPQETKLMHAVHFNKGCYLGQEIVERVRSRGHVNRLLERLRVERAETLPRGVKVLQQGNECGEVVSSVYSPREGAVVAMAYLRAEAIRQEAVFEAGGSAAQLIRSQR